MTFRALPLLAAALLAAAPLRAGDEVAAVLSSQGQAYMESFSAFQAAYGGEVAYFDASAGKLALPAGTKTVVTFGNKAASGEYPQGVNLVYALAPGFFMKPRSGPGREIKISMVPDFRVVMAKLRQIQPTLNRLAVFWAAPAYDAFVTPFQEAGSALGIKVSAYKVSDLADLPALLRRHKGEMDALWLPPDPLLITPESLMIFREFSWGNAMPMYATTKGLAREGACAAIGISFSEFGIAAAGAAKALRAGESVPDLIFPPKLEITLNASAARRCGIRLPEEIVREAAYLFP